MPLLLADRRHRSVTGTNDRFIRQGQYFFEIVLHRVFVGNGPAPHRPGKKRVADDRNRSSETGRNERHSSRRMSPGQPRFDVDLSDTKSFPFLDLFRARQRFAFRRENLSAGFFPQSRQVGDVIGMGMRE